MSGVAVLLYILAAVFFGVAIYHFVKAEDLRQQSNALREFGVRYRIATPRTIESYDRIVEQMAKEGWNVKWWEESLRDEFLSIQNRHFPLMKDL